MAWISPRTWTTGELVTAALINIHVRDNLNVVNPGRISLVVDEGTAVITTGSKLMFSIPVAMTISRWEIYTPGQPSSIQFQIYAVSYAVFPPASEDSINSGSPIQTSSAVKGQDTNPSSYGALAQGEAAALVATAVSGVTKAYVNLWFART